MQKIYVVAEVSEKDKTITRIDQGYWDEANAHKYAAILNKAIVEKQDPGYFFSVFPVKISDQLRADNGPRLFSRRSSSF